jgi:probable F420-dependent oxidoreductase
MSKRKFRFGVVVSTAASGEQWVDLARDVEQAGFSTMCLTDHFDDRFAPFSAAATALAATTTLRVGTLVLGNDYRHPVVMAKEAATLDVLSGGRFELGLGAGWMRSDYESAGMNYDAPGVRVARFAESVALCRALFGGDVVEFAGEHYQVLSLTGTPRPATVGGPRILIGGGGRKILSIAGQHADIIGINPTLTSGVIDAETTKTATAAYVDEKLQWVRAAAGDRFEELELSITLYGLQVTDDRNAFAEQVAPLFSMTPSDLLESPFILAGTMDQITETLHERRERWGLSYIVVQFDALEAARPIVAALKGR